MLEAHQRDHTMKLPKVGKEAPGFSATLENGSTVSVADYLGRPLLLIFLRHLA